MNHSEAGKLGSIKSSEISHLKKLNRIKEYEASPKKCAFCNLALPYAKKNAKFCNHHCSASFTNVARAKKTKCLHCLSICKKSKKFCSHRCRREYEWLYIKIPLIKNGKSTLGQCKKYILQIHGNVCMCCKNTEWMGKPIPIDIDHIDGNSENNSLDNLRLLYKNCHAQTPTYGAKNIGNGRKIRRERYLRDKIKEKKWCSELESN